VTAPARVTIGRALVTVLSAALAELEIPVERERAAALTKADCPRLLVFDAGDATEAEFVGGAELRMARFHIEAVEAARDTDRPTDIIGQTAADLADRVTTLQELARAALMANRTLSGACLGVFIEPAEEPRTAPAEDLRAAAFVAACAFATA
jgi:hypothetical protein